MNDSRPIVRGRGQVVLIALVFFAVFTAVAGSFITLVTIGHRAERVAIARAQAMRLAEAGIEKAVYELNENPSYAGETDTALGEGRFSTTVTIVDASTRLISTSATIASPAVTRKASARVTIDTSVVSFNYGIQTGIGGLSLANISSVSGNVYASGPVIGAGGNMIYGDVVSAGESGLIYGVHATSSAYAHTIGGAKPTEIDKDAYYASSLTNTTVGGTEYPGSADLPTQALPISDAQIEEWKTQAAAGNVIASPCPYVLDSETITLGPMKIACDVQIQGTSVVTLLGPVWVEGTLEIANTTALSIDPSLEGMSIAIVADKPSDPTGSGQIILQNSTTYTGAGEGSYIMLVSQNRSAEEGGAIAAIDVKNSATGDLIVYAGHGEIVLQNNVGLTEVTAYKVSLKNSANVVYESGLPSTIFQSGPGASWAFEPGTYGVQP